MATGILKGKAFIILLHYTSDAVSVMHSCIRGLPAVAEHRQMMHYVTWNRRPSPSKSRLNMRQVDGYTVLPGLWWPITCRPTILPATSPIRTIRVRSKALEPSQTIQPVSAHRPANLADR